MFNPTDFPVSDAFMRPVESVNWYQAIAFCNKLSIAHERTPVYSVTGVNFATLSFGDIPTSDNDTTWDNVTVDWNANGYRLPTEAEWEYAARAGTETCYYWGDSEANTGNYAWYNGNTSGGALTVAPPQPVGQKLPNDFGLYDMIGNVREWCWDWGTRTYTTSIKTNPTGRETGSNRINRGGCVNSDASSCRSAVRATCAPGSGVVNVGFRVLVVVEPGQLSELSTITVPAGTFEAGHTLTAGDVSPSGATYVLQWQRADTQDGAYSDIYGATDATYTLVSADANKWIRTQAIGTGSYTGTVYSTAVQVGEMPDPGPDIEITLPGDVIMALKSIPAGTFQMGSPYGLLYLFEQPRHLVTLTRSFYMGKYQVTQAQWLAVMGSWPGTAPSSSYGLGDNNPAYHVNWYDAVEFCNRLSIQQGKTPAYSLDGETNPDEWGGQDGSWDSMDMDLDADGYRLPTEAEWEYAARAGTETPWYWGDTDDDIDDYAWYSDNSNSQTQPVGQKLPNDFGLYDMIGNVREWCWDWYDEDYYSSSPGIDPTGPASGDDRVIRGSSYNSTPDSCRSAYRLPPLFTFPGFRLVRTIP